MKPEDFIYKEKKFGVNINTLSPNGKFYYRVSNIKSINMTNIGCDIAFFSFSNELLYFSKDTNAHWLPPWENPYFVLWSNDGNFAYYFQYKRNEIYDGVFLDLKNKIIYRVNLNMYENEINSILYERGNFSFDLRVCMDWLLKNRIEGNPIKSDYIDLKKEDARWLSLKKWYPLIKY